jgi:phenylpropionate dioxygenase-like ring-hydroxylating dioxygenase large terminal subunit
MTESSRPSLADYWHPIAASGDVTTEPRRFGLLGIDLVAFRTGDGTPAVFRDLCIHRGTPLSLGWTRDDRIVCPYHGWEYDGTGACVRIPSLPDDHPIPSKARAIAYRAADRYGLVWVALNEPVAPIPAFPNDEYDDPRYHAHLSSHNVFRTSAGRAIENFMDWSHFPFVHPNLLAPPDRTLVPPTDITETPFGLTYSYETIEPVAPTSGTYEVALYEYIYYVPFTVHIRIVTPDAGVSYCTMMASPTARNRTDAFVMFVRNHALDTPDAEFDYFSDRVNEQDRRIIESQRPEEIPLDLREELHIKVPDAPTIAFRRVLGRIAGVGEYADV